MPEVRPARHCRHCAGGCSGECLLGDGQCIHGWNGKRPREFTWRVLLNRRWWHRVLWGEQPWGRLLSGTGRRRPGNYYSPDISD